MVFDELEKRYHQLKAQYASGQMTEQQFMAEMDKLTVLDDQGQWWMLGAETGQWYVSRQGEWVRADPPRAAAAAPPPPPAAPAGMAALAAVPRKSRRGLAVGLSILAVVVLAGGGLAAYEFLGPDKPVSSFVSNLFGSSAEPTPQPTYQPQPTYTPPPATRILRPTEKPEATSEPTVPPTYTPRPTYTVPPTYTPEEEPTEVPPTEVPPTEVPPTQAPPPTPKPPPPTADPCAGIPADVSGSITPKCGYASTRFTMDFWGFWANEETGFWLNDESGPIIGTRNTVNIGPTGSVSGLWFLPSDFDLGPGLYFWVFEGVSSGHQSILYFKVRP
jgi:hypothetical protein